MGGKSRTAFLQHVKSIIFDLALGLSEWSGRAFGDRFVPFLGPITVQSSFSSRFPPEGR